MPVDPSIALNKDAPNVLTSLSSFMDLGRKKTALEREKGTLLADIARTEAEAESARTQADVAAATAKDRIKQQAAATSTAETGAESAKLQLSGAQMQRLRNVSNSLVNDPDFVEGNREKMIEKIADRRQELADAGVPKWMVESMTANMISQANKDPKSVRQMMLNSILAGQDASQQASTIQPAGISVSNGQQTQVVGTNQFGPTPPGQPIPGTVQQQQLPPTTPTFNSATNQPGYLGPQAAPTAASQGPQQWLGQEPRGKFQGDPKAIEAQIATIPDPNVRAEALRALQNQMAARFAPVSPVVSGPALGVAENTSGSVDVVNKDWTATSEAAQKASQNIGVLQNIKLHAGNASTGVGADRRAIAAGILGYLGIPEADMGKTDTDLLMKNSNMLALAGGNTDSARALAEAANPNIKMNEAAIRKAANQVIAQQQLALNKQQYLQQFKNDAAAYTRELSRFNQIADPRVLEFPNMSMEEKSELKSSMSPAEREEFGRKIEANRQLGFIK